MENKEEILKEKIFEQLIGLCSEIYIDIKNNIDNENYKQNNVYFQVDVKEYTDKILEIISETGGKEE